jgi:ABC-type glycerol-3-phosphate transport system substrate-binding protein
MATTSRWRTLGCMVIGCVLSTQGAYAGNLKVMLTGRANNAYFSKIIDAYQKSHRGTRITPIYLDWNDQATAIAKKPDVYIGPRYFLADNIIIGLFEDLNKLLPASTVKSFLPELLYSCSTGKQIFGVPIFGYCTSIAYNKGMFKQAGLAAPDSTWSWTGKFYEACKKLTRDANGDGIMEHHGFVGLPSWNFGSLFFSYGGTFHDRLVKKVTYIEKPGMNAINYILKLHKEKVVELVDWSNSVDGDPKTYPFNNGVSAMEINWTSNLKDNWYAQYFKDNKIPIEVGSAVIPSGPKGMVSSVDSDVVTMMCTSKNKKEAADFIRYMASAKGQEQLYDIYGALPTTLDGLTLPKVVKKVAAPFLKSYRLGKGRNINQQVNQIEGQLWGDLRNIVTGEGTMADLIENAKNKLSTMNL